MHVSSRILLSASLLVTLAQSAGLAATRDKDRNANKDVAASVEPQAENVRVEYAQVTEVEPVYETQDTGHGRDVVCDEIKVKARNKPAPVQSQAQSQSQSDAGEAGGWSRFWGKVKGWFGGGQKAAADAAAESRSTTGAARLPRCHREAQDGQQRAPVAYDVDYVYRGMKFRARLLQDPGSRLRIRVTVAPYGVDSQVLDAHN